MTLQPLSWYAVGATVLILLQAAVIAVLLLRRVGHRRKRPPLEERLRFETLLSELSAGLIHVPASGLDNALARGLARIVPFLGADRGALDEHRHGGPRVRISWAAPGIQELPPIMEVRDFPWTTARLRDGDVVRFSRPEQLPEAAMTDRAAYVRVGTRSHLSLPLHTNEAMLGVLSLDSVRDERVWSDDVVERLGLLSEAFARALERRRMEVSLADRLAFEQLLSSLSATFSNVTAVDVDREIERALHRIAQAFEFDQGGLIELSGEGQTGRTWMLDGRLTGKDLPWVLSRIQRGDHVSFSPADQLPDEATVDRASCLAQGVTSGVAFPLVVGGIVVGGLLFATAGSREAARPPEDLLKRLRLVGEVFANILSRNHAELEGQRLRQEMAYVGRVSAMGELTASLAHELNQPLTAILNNAQVAQRLLAGEAVDLAEMREILNDIVADDKRAADVIKRLRLLLKKGDLEYTGLDLNEVVSDVARLVTSDAAIRNVPLCVDAACVPQVRGDRVQLQQVVLNLVLNGLDAMRETEGNRSLLIRTFADGDDAAGVAVLDTGAGIAAKDLPHIFEPLYTTKAEGIGMGLAIARTIIEAHGGRLTATNNDDGGATFQFTLPADEAIRR